MLKVVSHWPCIAGVDVELTCSMLEYYVFGTESEAANLLDFRDPQSRAGVKPAGISVRSLPVDRGISALADGPL